MEIIAVDDEKIALEGLLEIIQEVVPDAGVKGFRNAKEAGEYASKHHIDVAFLDIEMRDMDGISLAKHIKKINSRINIIFTTGYSEFTGQAMELHASGYILKPATAEKVKRELEELRNPPERTTQKRIRVKTFGYFEVYLDGAPIAFKYTKTKELLAFLIDRNGALCSNKELSEVLWEEDVAENHMSYLKNLRTDLINTFAEAGCSEFIVRQWGKLGIVPDMADCDYYLWLKGTPEGINAYHGEYMTQYSWAEYTHASIDMVD